MKMTIERDDLSGKDRLWFQWINIHGEKHIVFTRIFDREYFDSEVPWAVRQVETRIRLGMPSP